MDWTNVTIFLTWLAGVGSPIVVMMFFSLVAENWAKWATFPVLLKKWLPFVLSILLSVVSSIFLKYPAYLAQIQPWFQMVVVAILAYISSQKTYQGSLKAQYGARFSRQLRRG
jgi:chromate transport protein ChrA